jgi:ribosome-associated protein YbcJ (S4-like RNA binding protein)
VIGDSASLDITNFITLEAWIRAESVPSSGGQARVVSKSFNYELSVYGADPGCVSGTAGDVQWRGIIGGLDRRICGGSLIPGTWHHVAGTYDGKDFILYVDGDPVARTERSGLIGTNNEDVIIGNHPTLERPFDGGIDEVRVWNVARTEQEIRNDMNWELSGSEAGLVGYYRLNEGVGQDIFDGSAYGNHGILGSTAGADVNDPRWWPSNQTNMAPEVNAGADQVIEWPEDTVNLAGTVSDDGLPVGIVNVRWSKVSGPGAVVFVNEYSLTTTATFSMEGTYVLRLTADDTQLSSSDDVVVAVVSDSYGYPKSVWLEFDGVDDKAVIGDSASLDITNFITLEAWIRAESIPSSGGQARIVSKSFNYELSLYSADQWLRWRVQPGMCSGVGIIGGLDRRICGGSIIPGTWHHVAGTYDGSDFILYVDGNPVASIARSGLIGTNNYAVNIGNHPTLEPAV